MSTTAVERLMRDLKRLQQDAPPSDDDIMLWIAIIVGAFCQLFMFPANNIMAFDFFTVFSQALVGLFVTELLPLLVPFGLSSGCYKPPSLLNLIWQSQMPLHKLMLGDPNPYSPANQQAATMLIERRIDYYKKAQRIVELSCKAV